MKVLVVGGISGGMSAAARLRRLTNEAEIIVFERGPRVAFSNCALPFHISEEVKDADINKLVNDRYNKFRKMGDFY